MYILYLYIFYEEKFKTIGILESMEQVGLSVSG